MWAESDLPSDTAPPARSNLNYDRLRYANPTCQPVIIPICPPVISNIFT